MVHLFAAHVGFAWFALGACITHMSWLVGYLQSEMVAMPFPSAFLLLHLPVCVAVAIMGYQPDSLPYNHHVLHVSATSGSCRCHLSTWLPTLPHRTDLSLTYFTAAWPAHTVGRGGQLPHHFSLTQRHKHLMFHYL